MKNGIFPFFLIDRFYQNLFFYLNHFQPFVKILNEFKQKIKKKLNLILTIIHHFKIVYTAIF